MNMSINHGHFWTFMTKILSHRSYGNTRINNIGTNSMTIEKVMEKSDLELGMEHLKKLF